MGTVGPLELAGAVQAVARVLAGAAVHVIGLDGRGTYLHESVRALITVSVHLDGPDDVDRAGHLFALDGKPQRSHSDLYSRGGHWQGGVYVSLYGPARRAGRVVAVGS